MTQLSQVSIWLTCSETCRELSDDLLVRPCIPRVIIAVQTAIIRLQFGEGQTLQTLATLPSFLSLPS